MQSTASLRCVECLGNRGAMTEMKFGSWLDWLLNSYQCKGMGIDCRGQIDCEGKCMKAISELIHDFEAAHATAQAEFISTALMSSWDH